VDWVDAGLTGPGGTIVVVSPAELVDMFRKMVMIREFDQLAIELRKNGRIHGVLHPYVGEEAVAVGACSGLRTTDRITSTHRGHGHCIAKGADINRMMAELFGRVDGYCKGKGGSMHIADFSIGMLGANGIVGGGMPIACGAALAAQLEDAGGVAACFFGDGATGEGEFHESLNIASVWKLPLLFVCENNQYGADNAVESVRVVADISMHAAAYGMPGVSVDGNDVLAVHDAASEAVERGRRGDGPTLIVCKTFRWLFHAMRDVPPPETRPANLLTEWRSRYRDPITRFEDHLTGNRIVTEAEVLAIREQVKRDLDAAVDFAEASPYPDPKDLLVDMFAE
jgi:TPP-dependent pyruvate/acetoin dehydrogenase alpha subunit